MPRIDPERSAMPLAPPALPGAAIVPPAPYDELETPPLPREHPKWVKDAVAVSNRTRQLIARLRPIALRVLTFWDHHVRGIVVGGREFTVDVSGSYRLD